MGVVMHYELQWDPERRSSWPLLTRCDVQVTWGQRSGDEVNVTVSGSQRGRETEKQRSKGEKMKKKSKAFHLYSFRIQMTYSANCNGKSSPPPPDSPSNGVVFKTFITNSLLLIFQQQGLKLCLLSNWEPVASGPNQSNLLTAFLGGGWRQKQHYCTSRPFALCATSNYFNFRLSKMVICGVGKMSGSNEGWSFPQLFLVRKWMPSLSGTTFKEYASYSRWGFWRNFQDPFNQ